MRVRVRGLHNRPLRPAALSWCCAPALLNPVLIPVAAQLHQMLPSILTCVVGKRLSAPGQNHWELRDSASTLVAHVCHRCVR